METEVGDLDEEFRIIEKNLRDDLSENYNNQSIIMFNRRSSQDNFGSQNLFNSSYFDDKVQS